MENISSNFEEEFQGIEFEYIDMRKLHLVFDKYKGIAAFNFKKLASNLKSETEIRKYFVDTTRNDITMILKIQSILGNVSCKNDILKQSLEKRPVVLGNKAKQLENLIAIEKNKLEFDTSDQEIEKLKNERTKFEKEMKENLIQKSYSKLSKTKDGFEIKCVKAISGVILNLRNPKSTQMEALLKQYSEMFNKIVLVDPISISSIVAGDINIHLIDIFSKFDSPKFENEKNNYIHLLPFLKWAKIITEINMLGRIQLNLPKARISKITNKINTIEEVKTIRTLIPIVSEQNENVMKESLNFIKKKEELQIILEGIVFYRTDCKRIYEKEFKEINNPNDKSIRKLLYPNEKEEKNAKQFETGIEVSDSGFLPCKFCGFCWTKRKF